MRLAGAAVAGLLAACFAPQYDQPLCGSGGTCPEGLTCADDGLCRSPWLVDAPDFDAAIDAPTDACVVVPGGDLCNGLDDDCDGFTDEGFEPGVACDGADGDLCIEGVVECDSVTGATRCSDQTGTLIEVCNDKDDDCDIGIDENVDVTSDAANCGACGHTCTNALGTTQCKNSVCVPACTAGANDCDGVPDNGCELRDTNPVCDANMTLGTVNGDVSSTTLVASGVVEGVYSIRVNEVVSGNVNLGARVVLTSAPGTNFDLTVTCNACGGASVSSTTSGIDAIDIGRLDAPGDTSFIALVEVRWTSSIACGAWTLTVDGNVGTPAIVCP